MNLRIAGVTLQPQKRIIIALTYIHGIGNTRSKEILKKLGITENAKGKDLSVTQVDELRGYIEKTYKLEGDLRREKLMNIKRLKEINTYRGTRHSKGLPVRGQRTKTNSRTIRGNVRRTMGSGKKPPGQKT
ncbi:MAG: 30S ribosomal protein S13 [Candidatus Kerfeldbacteria bacterium CG08_land_8_20_14_0_20_42_7]|uniref:Small ribosomal subunit protein uS13 n=1 Tax=Candidatus Kerfeldbacteria bacterium CG08_land_8_20_14_0_20_42_7 TaxID=2014245 RepID=A0A2H0YUV8_9BACT|nr:MAG: 30S ribosomal protein S13 [Candidatus Kerfeldbacteria bacterium CG08_land_8_20_14_0_20_42_7]